MERRPSTAASYRLAPLLVVGCGGGTKTVTVPATGAPTTATSDLVTPLVACLDKSGANTKTSEQRPPNDQENYQPMVHANGYVDALDPWRATGGYYIWIYRTHGQAQAAIKAQQADDAQTGYAGLNKDLRAFENLAVGPGAGSATRMQTEVLADCILNTPP
jgi:hypothetical protein